MATKFVTRSLKFFTNLIPLFSGKKCEVGDACCLCCKQWGCRRPQVVILKRVNKMLKPEKWQTIFDSGGRILGFQKVLKLITLGGVDPSIRPEVWEFLLGCYALSSTKEYREVLRAARRERYEELVKECQQMHSSIGTGSLAYVIGSKIMDMRTYSKDNESEGRQTSDDNTNKLNDYCDRNDNCTDTTDTCLRESDSDSSDNASVIESIDSAAGDSSGIIPSLAACDCNALETRRHEIESEYPVHDFFDFPALPVTNLFDKSDPSDQGSQSLDDGFSSQWNMGLSDGSMPCSPIRCNQENIVEANSSPSEVKVASEHYHEPQKQVSQHDASTYKSKVLNKLRMSDVPETVALYSSNGEERGPSEDKISEWLWTLHRIVVDVVRTDTHLEFYEDRKNLARMSDILAVYAWVDPATGYCQGMSDLLSPFVVLFENDADAFWCFEMLLRRNRENFRMEGETGVMKQLQSLWHILKLIDREIFSHLTHVGAESLHFAFRMLLVLFRRELSFNDSLCMWEMMWAADFDETLAMNLAQSCLEPLEVQVPNDTASDIGDERKETIEEGSSKSSGHSKRSSIEHDYTDEAVMKMLASSNSFCGLTRSFWSRNERAYSRSMCSTSRSREDALPVFCAAAILILNRHKIIKETHSIDDLIKIFNDNLLKIKVRRCVRTAVKLRRKYFYKLTKNNNPSPQTEPVDWPDHVISP